MSKAIATVLVSSCTPSSTRAKRPCVTPDISHQPSSKRIRFLSSPSPQQQSSSLDLFVTTGYSSAVLNPPSVSPAPIPAVPTPISTLFTPVSSLYTPLLAPSTVPTLSIPISAPSQSGSRFISSSAPSTIADTIPMVTPALVLATCTSTTISPTVASMSPTSTTLVQSSVEGSTVQICK